MALTDIDKQLDALRNQAQKHRDNVWTLLNAVRANALLSVEGQDDQIRGDREKAIAAIKALRAQEEKIVDERILSLERRVFGEVSSSSDVIAIRDAADRAEQLESDAEALRLFERAKVTRDEGLATAVVRRAVAMRFLGTLEAFEKSDPSKAEALRDLTALTAFRDTPFDLTRELAYQPPQ
ncbi:hypothetical protein [Microcella alkalica]|uniref:Uncharacterized protein n=1 Tax=Microcella alkalica TaxID=355930 RepID=A0A839EAY7_9MICO|nr:hypothetical protein [Microcella alkalica]MBA8847404.1 hypothetical protein [Microcella alkalica]